MRRPLLVLASLAAFSTACDTPCPLIDCEGDGLAIHAVPENGNPLVDGTYEVWVLADGVDFETRCTLAELSAATCSLEAADGQAIGSNSLDVSIAVAGDDVPRDIRVNVRRFSGRGVEGPNDVTVAIALDGTQIGTAAYRPDYGGGAVADAAIASTCGACEQATVMLDLAAS